MEIWHRFTPAIAQRQRSNAKQFRYGWMGNGHHGERTVWCMSQKDFYALIDRWNYLGDRGPIEWTYWSLGEIAEPAMERN